ncbi:hypothetical protein [Amycolatopsis sp. CA-126428]|uniref:hypothetical protein n=1 Tax=Amycolatopsis sp. CA-126428 TaxID=2073158 RepID=UPI0011B03929|nr:hypothetical protein [Amycolatopsis sp. CA-126428]
MSLFRGAAVTVALAVAMTGSASVAVDAAPAKPNVNLSVKNGVPVTEADLPANAPPAMREAVKATNSPRANFAGWPAGCWLYLDLWAENQRTEFVFQWDSNLVVYVDGSPRWDSKTYNGGWSICYQSDGNVVIYSRDGVALWDTKTWGNPGDWIYVQPDSNVVIYSADNRALWDTKTWR